MGPSGRALSRLRIMHSRQHLPSPPPGLPTRGPTLKGYAVGPATKILDLELGMGGVEGLFSVLIAVVKSSNLVRSFWLMWRHWRELRC